MSLTQIQTIIDRLRSAGITVHESAGWQSRSNGQTAAYVGGLVHHTATPFGFAPGILITGRPDLSGPLCNFAGNEDGSITVIAAGPANHAGASGGRSMGPLPVTTAFNARVLGLEIVYPGDVPMRPAQYRTALIWGRIVADVVGFGDIERIRAHAETSITGKWDPGFAPGRTIDMVAFRRDARNVLEKPDMTEDEHKLLVRNNALLEALDSGFIPGGGIKRLGALLQRNNAILEALDGSVTGGVAHLVEALQNQGVSPAEIQAAFVAALPSLKVTGEFHA